MHKKPSIVAKNVLIFGAARILNGNHGEAISFFKSNLSKCKNKDMQWVRWFHGFSYLLAGDFSAAEFDFLQLAVSSKNALITGLSAYFLNNSIKKYSINPKKCIDTAENGKERIKKSISNIETWTKEADRMGTDIHIAIIRKYIDEAGNWLFDIIPPVAEIPKPEPQERRRTDRRRTERRTENRTSSERRSNDRRTKRDLY